MKTATVTERIPTSALSTTTVSLGGVLLCALAKKVSDATSLASYSGWMPELVETTKEAIGKTPLPAETDWITYALNSVRDGGAALWNWIPTSTRLLLAAGLIAWTWKKWRGETGAGVHVQNHHKVEIHFHGCETKPAAAQRVVHEKDGSSTTVIDLQVPRKELHGRKFALLNLNL